MNKVPFLDRRVGSYFLKIAGIIGSSLSILLLFFNIPQEYKFYYFLGFIAVLTVIYVTIWIRSNKLHKININIEGTEVKIKVGDIFTEKDFKVIAFNEYFDTQVDDIVINERSLNGIFIKQYLNDDVSDLDKHISNYDFEEYDKLGTNEHRKKGKKNRYQIGAICVYNDFLLTALTKFNCDNKAILTMPEYIEFLINFWNKVNKVYAQKSVSVPIFGSGITRIEGHRTIKDEDLLKIMLWTFRISEMRFKYPAKLSIIIHKAKIDEINLLDIKFISDGV